MEDIQTQANRITLPITDDQLARNLQDWVKPRFEQESLKDAFSGGNNFLHPDSSYSCAS